jgi:hypothetical protein
MRFHAGKFKSKEPPASVEEFLKGAFPDSKPRGFSA